MSIDGSKRTAADLGMSLQYARSSGLTYEPFYGLKEKPFSLSSEPSFFYNSNAHSAAFDALLSGINRRESLSVLTGDIGMGKTTVCRAVLQQLDRQTLSAFVPDPFASREDLLKVVLADFGVVSAEDLATGRLRGASRTELSYLLYEFLDTLAPLQAFAVVFIDEAQNLSLPLLEEIRILSESDGRRKQLQVVLVGQLELRDKLRLPEMRQLAQRVTVRCSLDALDRDGVAGYISHRLHIAGGAPDRVRFSHEAIDTVFEASAGVPRIINRLCDRALHHAHARRTAVVDPALVRTAAAEVDATALIAPRVAQATPQPDDASAIDRPEGSTVDASKQPSDTWFAKVDAHVSSAADPADAADIATIAEVIAAHSSGYKRSGPMPLTHMQAIRRRWVRRVMIAVLVALVVGGAGVGLSLAYTVLNEPVVPPPLPAVAHSAPPVPQAGPLLADPPPIDLLDDLLSAPDAGNGN